MTIGTLTRAAAIALALGATSLSGAPVQAQGFSLGFHIGTDDDFFIKRPLRLCLLTDNQLRRAIRQQGYRLGKGLGHHRTPRFGAVSLESVGFSAALS